MYFLNKFPICVQILFKITKETGTDQFFIPSFIKIADDKYKNNLVLSSMIYEFFKYYQTGINMYSERFERNEKDKSIIFSLILADLNNYDLGSDGKNFFRRFINLGKVYRKSEESVLSDFILFCEDVVNKYDCSKFGQSNVESVNCIYNNAKKAISYLLNLEGQSDKFDEIKNEQEADRKYIINKANGVKPDYKFGSKSSKQDRVTNNDYSNSTNDFINMIVKYKNDYVYEDITYIEWARSIWIECDNNRNSIIEAVTRKGLIRNGLSNECAVIIVYIFKDYLIRAESLRNDTELSHLVQRVEEKMGKLMYAINVQYGDRSSKEFNRHLGNFIRDYISEYHNDSDAQKDSVSREIFYSLKGFQIVGDFIKKN